MTEQGRRIAAPWRDPGFVAAWTAGDAMSDLLAFPRRLAAALVAADRPQAGVIIDIAGGPGAFLAGFLEEFPAARGIWSDASEAMLGRARETLAPYAERVEFRPADMTDLAAAGLPAEVDVIVTSRAAHHLDRAGLTTFYGEAAALLAPSGWLINLDHTGPDEAWDKRFRAVRPRFVPPGPETKHHHNYPLPSVEDHLSAYAHAGFADVEIAWKAFYTCLFMGKKPA
jgi:ubiquinone/menaquinone biosynthesis C-methylase UbiE